MMTLCQTRLSLVALAMVVACITHSTESYSADSPPPSRRSFLRRAASTASFALVGGASASTVLAAAQEGLRPPAALAATATQIFETPNGVKYAVLSPAKDKFVPAKGDIVAIEYTGYLTDGSIFDSTHAEGKSNALMFQLGGNAVIDGINEMVGNMGVGMKVQAIIPPGLAFGDKGLCLEGGECLIKPKATLVYDIALKRASIAPP